ncbi:MAG: hypothetical protein ACK504_11705 [Bacteroidota bacterium]
MKELLKKLVPKFILKWHQEKFQRELVKNWYAKSSGKAPPHIIKQLHIKNLKTKFNTNILVETGTYLGAMVKAQADTFKKIYTIEVSEEIYIKTKKSLSNLTHVEFMLGDSGEVLKKLASQISETALFWLDGHYSFGITSKGVLNTPIYKELDYIFGTNFDHVILIDDAMDFTGNEDYPTIEELQNYVKTKKENYVFNVKDNMIFVLPFEATINID